MNTDTHATLLAEKDAEIARLRAVAVAAREWRKSWKILDDSYAAVERRRKAREAMFAALDALELTDA